MPIGTLYVDIAHQAFLPVRTILGTMYVVPAKDRTIRKGDFEVRKNSELESLSTPVKFYDMFSGDVKHRSGYGFLGPVTPEVLDFGLIFRYRNPRATDKPPTLLYRSQDFCVYHTVNGATVVTIPRTINEIEELLLAI